MRATVCIQLSKQSDSNTPPTHQQTHSHTQTNEEPNPNKKATKQQNLKNTRLKVKVEASEKRRGQGLDDWTVTSHRHARANDEQTGRKRSRIKNTKRKHKRETN